METVIAVKVRGKLEWRTSRSATSQRWIGVCDPMNLTMEADSLDELFSVIGETMQLVLADLLADDELDEYLRERGWTAGNLPQSRDVSDIRFDVPWQLVAESARRDSERRAH